MKPPQGSSRDQIRQAHRAKMKRKAERRATDYERRDNPSYDDRRNSRPGYRKSIWPTAKIAMPGRMG